MNLLIFRFLISKDWWNSFVAEQEKCKYESLSEITLPPISNENLVQCKFDCFKFEIKKRGNFLNNEL